MLPPSSYATEERKREEHVKDLRRELQEQYKQDFQESIINDKEFVSW